jgi:hypothetical protein
VHKEPRRPGPGHDVEALTQWRLRALQLGVAIFTLLLLLSLIGVVLR